MASLTTTQTQDENKALYEAFRDTIRTAKEWSKHDKAFARGMFHALALTAIDLGFKDLERECYSEGMKLGGFAE